MSFMLFGPSQSEVDQVAHELIVTHGLNAHEEAVRLSEVATHSTRRTELYKLAGDRIKISFAMACEKIRERNLPDPRVMKLIERLNAQEVEGPRPAF